jgi:hypothetical protein
MSGPYGESKKINYCGVKTAFDFYESRFHDAICAEEIVRVFVVPWTCS